MGFKRDEVASLQSPRTVDVPSAIASVVEQRSRPIILFLKPTGSHEIDNAIPVCFGCRAEIHSYNDRHPRGRKFTSDELQRHKAQWLQICEQNPGALLASSRTAEVGPLQALIDELEFNVVVCGDAGNRGALFVDEQFRRAIAQGPSPSQNLGSRKRSFKPTSQ